MYGGLFDFRRFVLLTSEKKRHGTDQGSGILILQQKPKATERNGTPPQFHLAMQWLVLATEQCTAGAAW